MIHISRWFTPFLLMSIVLATLASAESHVNSPEPTTRPQCVAFSLAEAQHRLSKGDRDDEIQNLGGITRIVGFVHDSDDVILVGIREPRLPDIQLDELALALRSRCVNDQWPRLSLDPDEHDRRQLRVAIQGQGVSHTRLHADLLRGDIWLKTFAFRTHREAGDIDLLFNHFVRALPTLNVIAPEDYEWSLDDVGTQVERRAATSRLRKQNAETFSARVWIECSSEISVCPDDPVWVINSLPLVALAEDQVAIRNATGAQSPAIKFSADLSARLATMTPMVPELARVKSLEDLMALSEAVRVEHLTGAVQYLLNDVVVPPPNQSDVVDSIPVTKIVGHARGMGNDYLVRIEGGIALTGRVKWLQKGQFFRLAPIVLAARPSTNALAWPLDELKEYRPPNTADLAVFEPGWGAPKPGGAPVVVQSAVLSPVAPGAVFGGFRDDLKGVYMNADLTKDSFVDDPELEAKRSRLMQSHDPQAPANKQE